MGSKITSPKTSNSSAIALQLITFLLSDDERMDRFTSLSGMGLSDLKEGVQNPVFLGFMLDYALQDEPLILAFAENQQISPQTLVLARRQLPGASDDF